MQELRFVLIVVGGLAIAALLFHGLWTSKKEGKAKFGDKPLGKLEGDNQDDYPPLPEDDYEIIVKDKKEPELRDNDNMFDTKLNSDPLFDSHETVMADEPKSEFKEPDFKEPEFKEPEVKEFEEPLNDIPSFSAVEPEQATVEAKQEEVTPVADVVEPQSEPAYEPQAFEASPYEPVQPEPVMEEIVEPVVAAPVEEQPEPEMEVIVLNVHCAGEEPFIGTELFDSMTRHGLTYGEMNIFHCFSEPNAQGKVLFSVANMMHPGTLEHTDPADFSTKGISFFMTLPGFGESDQNFNTMLRTAQEIANDLGGNVLDDQRNLMTPDRLGAYRRQIVDFNAANA